ncbi:MAG: 2-oxoacid:acceptor oxidoreductase family protein [Bacillus sp. (in: Bacteria)]|nr:2-oxoacid:acceptor oxidoreductase family protein [Bacillus sp. (in: firmicutes)]
MQLEIVIAGFGGQGVMSMGQLLAYAGMNSGKEVSWMPSYGPEQRGGTANVSVVISDKEIGSPVVSTPSVLIALNNPSFEKFEPLVKENGIVLVNGDLVEATSNRKDIEFYSIEANKLAEELGNNRVAGMILLGAFIEKTGILTKDSLIHALTHVLGKNKAHLIEVNERALMTGEKEVNGLIAKQQ